jgi:hypothetical protein
MVEAKRQSDKPQAHTNYQVSMVLEALIGIVDISDSADFLHPVTRQPVGNMTLHQVLLKYFKLSNRHSKIAKVHPANPALETTIISPTHWKPRPYCYYEQERCRLSWAYAHRARPPCRFHSAALEESMQPHVVCQDYILHLGPGAADPHDQEGLQT